MKETAKLKRSITLPLLTLYGLGTIIGAGIFILVGEVAGRAGMHAPVAFLLASIIAGFTAFSYAELSSRFPRSASEAVYVDAAFQKPWLSKVIGWSVIAVGTLSSATIASGVVGYVDVFFHLPAWLVASLLLVSMGLLAAWGINESVWMAALTSAAAIVALIAVVTLASDTLSTLPERLPELIPAFSFHAWNGILFGAFIAFYAFIGFEDMVNVAEEVKAPRKNLPLAIILALTIATLLYVLIALVAVLSLPPHELAGNKAPLVAIIKHSGHTASHLIAMVSIIAIVNGVLIQIIMASRVLYGMGSQHMAPALFAYVHPLTRTPLVSTAVITMAILFLALILPLVTLAQITSFITLLIFTAINAALWRIKKNRVRTEAEVSYPVWVPATGFTLSILFILLQFL